MKDIQSEKDKRGITIQKVGISGFEMPFTLKDPKNTFQYTVGTWSAYVRLKDSSRGTHMSRFAEILNHWKNVPISLAALEDHVKPEIRKALGAAKAHLEVKFKYFITKETPVSAMDCVFPVSCRFTVSDYHRPMLEVKTPVTTLCPCSKEISKGGGAHNQRSFVTIHVNANKGAWIWIEDLVRIAEESASCPIWPLLKRPDEKWVTEKAYANPRFVEDVVREAALRLRQLDLSYFKVTCENEESIHCHNAYADYEEAVVQKTWQKVAKDPAQKKVDSEYECNC